MPTFTHTIENHNLLYFSSFFFVFLVFCFAIYFLNSLSFFAFVPCDEPLHLYLPNIVVVFYLKLRFVIFLFDDFHIYHSLNWWPYDWITQNWSPLVAQSHESVTTNADPNAPNNWTTIFFRPFFFEAALIFAFTIQLLNVKMMLVAFFSGNDCVCLRAYTNKCGDVI